MPCFGSSHTRLTQCSFGSCETETPYFNEAMWAQWTVEYTLLQQVVATDRILMPESGHR